MSGLPNKTGSNKITKGTWALLACLGAFLATFIYGFWFASSRGLIPHITVHGYVAMAIGIFFSLLIGCGLMWLSFYSAREGFDDRADPGRLKK
jgi:hypothetical protein